MAEKEPGIYPTDTNSPTYSLGKRLSAEIAARRGQACDRCRRRKIKCDGDAPSCGNCLAGGETCVVSATPHRKRKVKNFVGTSVAQTSVAQPSHLQDEVARLRRLLDVERATNRELRNAMARQSPITALQHRSRGDAAMAAGQSHLPVIQNRAYSAHVLKHMGRMVFDECGIGRFAGITTGVHFIQTLDAAWQQRQNKKQPFPEGCYQLFLTSPSLGPAKTDLIQASWSSTVDVEDASLPRGQLLQFLGHPLSCYMGEVHRFLLSWEPLCPILVPEDISESVISMIEGALDDVDYPTLMMMMMIFAINQLGSPSRGMTFTSAPELDYFATACRLRSVVTAQGSLKSLQALCLLAFYHQVAGQSSKLADLSGSLVRMAQSLALHRHFRRFRLPQGEIEHRKRLWWWVFAFDKVTAMTLGLPQLINEANVDVESPTDCILKDTSSGELNYPLPGDITPIHLFNQYIALTRLVSNALTLLYTTNERYGGVDNIAKLNKDLQVWQHTFETSYQSISPEEGLSISSSLKYTSYDMVKYWLQILMHLTSILIHRPGLTFDADTEEFSQCLNVCVSSSRALLDALRPSHIPPNLTSLLPIGSSLAFQCALMHAYQYCFWPNLARSTEYEYTTTAADAISDVVGILEHHAAAERRQMPPGTAENFYLKALSDAVAVMEEFLRVIQAPHLPPVEGGASLRDSIQDGADLRSSVLSSSADAALPHLHDQSVLDSADFIDNALSWMDGDVVPFPYWDTSEEYSQGLG